MRAAIASQTELEEFLKTGVKKTTYGNVVEEMERVQAPLSYSWGVVGHLMGVKNSDALRKAHDTMQPQVIHVNQQIGQSQVIFQALNALHDDGSTWESLEEAQQRIVSAAITQMQSSGVGLPPTQREAFNKLQQEAAELSTKFSNNVLDSTKQFKLLLTDPKDITGLPASAKALAAQQALTAATATQKAKDAAAEQVGKTLAKLTELTALSGSSKTDIDAAMTAAATAQSALAEATAKAAELHAAINATADSGPWMITLDIPSYLPAMQHLQSSTLREKLYRAYVTRASSGAHDNAPIIQRILQIKTEMAQMLGYSCHAEKSLSRKMARSVDEVLALTEMLRSRAMPHAQRELQELRAFAKAQGHKGDLALWDVPYWSERLREQQYQFSEEELRVYFALPAVLDGLFKLADRFVVSLFCTEFYLFFSCLFLVSGALVPVCKHADD
jgi:oligopeptidase A